MNDNCTCGGVMCGDGFAHTLNCPSHERFKSVSSAPAETPLEHAAVSVVDLNNWLEWIEAERPRLQWSDEQFTFLEKATGLIIGLVGRANLLEGLAGGVAKGDPAPQTCEGCQRVVPDDEMFITDDDVELCEACFRECPVVKVPQKLWCERAESAPTAPKEPSR